MTQGYLSLGSNLGDRVHNLNAALKALPDFGAGIIKSSQIYETKAIEVVDQQENYLNMVIRINTGSSPLELLDICQNIEDRLGRKRPYKHSPRTIDIDILLLDGVSINTKRLIIPHPRIEFRQFVIYPLAEIAPDMVFSSGKHIMEVKKALGDDEILRIWKIKDG